MDRSSGNSFEIESFSRNRELSLLYITKIGTCVCVSVSDTRYPNVKVHSKGWYYRWESEYGVQRKHRE